MNPGRGNVEARTAAPGTDARTNGEKAKDEILKDGPENAAGPDDQKVTGQAATKRRLFMS